ncbi:bicoid-interacting protein BIN3, putative [Plasmodium chabaudi chabaudi]|uniref:RNA methyltransferase n=1 Tax=Plasmodium chabaudi chabaudi TaxID=31271 RepID=A0A4V0K610_PLACU|nr:bicoid-interacting protein BIN3, putative [Plasmodium chabaudi chabaudi]VTZ67915.1 bicoid-interacting protein BIN3, putative [Plasmodium chabaudi chabaudi]|eukprot:XP_738369.2 bicoid-interacting protein BIN3, putative [Plasmodium chabaudi chabaudi]
MAICIFEKTEKKKLRKILNYFKLSSEDVLYSENYEDRGNGKKRKICLHGNYQNYFFERYMNRKIICKEDNENNILSNELENKIQVCEITGCQNESKDKIDDYRLSNINNLIKDIFKNKIILDIGCNYGITTFLLSLKYKCKTVNGIDIDYNIINKNISILKLFFDFILIYNKQKHMLPFLLNKHFLKTESSIFNELHLLYEELTLKGVDKTDEERSDHNLEVCQNEFPFNIYFSCSNIFDKCFENVQNKYDVIICFSVLKWIHLNYGDNKLILFFDLVYKLLKNGGYFILEYHREIKYKLKKNEKIFFLEKKQKLKMNYTHFDDIAQGLYNNASKFVLINKTDFKANTKEDGKERRDTGMFNRTICIYKKVCNDGNIEQHPFLNSLNM